MAGHSHWHNIKFKKEKNDAKKAKNNQRYSREIMVAVQKGGANIEYNHYLKSAIQSAKSNGVSRDIIDKAIKKGLDSKILQGEPVIYEIFTDGGIAIIADGFSEVPSKSYAQIKEFVNKYNGIFAKCLHLFVNEGVAEINNCTVNDILENAGDFIEDYYEDSENNNLILTFNTQHLEKISEKLSNFNITRCEAIYRAKSYVTKLQDMKKVNQLLEAIENLDFINNIYTNIEE